jgi:hypothetical protein
VVTEFMILVNYAQKIEHYHDKQPKLRVFWAKLVLFGLTTASGLVFMFGSSLPLHNLFFIAFLAVHTFARLTQQGDPENLLADHWDYSEDVGHLPFLLPVSLPLHHRHLHLDLR